MNQPQPQRKNKLPTYFVFFLPALVLFDFVYYWWTRSSCLECNNVSYFIQNSSLSAFVVMQAWQALRRK